MASPKAIPLALYSDKLEPSVSDTLELVTTVLPPLPLSNEILPIPMWVKSAIPLLILIPELSIEVPAPVLSLKSA